MKKLFLYKGDTEYSKFDNYYSPVQKYPEYPWDDERLVHDKNDVYNAVRECFFGLEMDILNFGTPNWNPLGEIIRKGDTVLIKPNWVSHKNNNPNFGLDCLITHPSVLRPIIDYVLIALGGTGKIIIGDAPIQGANLQSLFDKSHLNVLFDFYKKKGISFEICDFRLYESIGKNGVYSEKRFINPEEMAATINLNNKSYFHHIEKQKRVYQVMDYSSGKTMSFHESNNHIYSINKTVLQADVIINLPKPKTHKLAGITGAQKNMVGIVADKACLPHVSLGSKTENGDAFPSRSILKDFSSLLREKKAEYENVGAYFPALFIRYIDAFIRLIIKKTAKNKYELGSWYGNDTVWRTIFDLNNIVKYADKSGLMQNAPQRKIFHLADMIISGEGNGPLAPSPKKTGYLIAGTDPVLIDKLIAKLMGFNFKKIPSVANALNFLEKKSDDTVIFSNDEKFNYKSIDEVKIPETMKFLPPFGWLDHVEV